MNRSMNEHLREAPADDADAHEPSVAAELTFAIGIGLVIAGVGAFSAITAALMWSSLF